MARSGSVVVWTCVGLLSLAAVAAADGASDDSLAVSRRAPARSALVLAASLGREHDDNVLQLTRRNLDRFAATPGPPRFRIAQVGDWSTTAGVSVRGRARLLPRRESRARLDAEVRRYDLDDIADREEYSLSLAQELTPSRRRLATLELWTAHLPNYYLGEFTDLNESVAAGTRVRESATFRQTDFGARLRQGLWRGRLEVAAARERVHRTYNAHFQERTNDNDQWQLDARLAPLRAWPASVRVSWLRGDLNAAGDRAATPGVVEPDISYDHDGVGVGLTLPWGRDRWRGRLDGSIVPEVRTYTTGDKFDLLRFGRVNHRRDTTLRVVQRVWGPLEAVAVYEKLTSRAEFRQGITFPAQQTDFAQEQFALELRASWELARR